MELKNASLLQTQTFIGNKWMNAKSGKTFKVINPATLEIIASVQDCGVSETEFAIEAASSAFNS